jgi:regulator of telomere elongation helicase 1
MQAIRATNQAIGRVIRHLNDHGAIIFMDQRFSYKNNLNNISGWIREVTQNYDEFGPAYRAIIQFFK